MCDLTEGCQAKRSLLFAACSDDVVRVPGRRLCDALCLLSAVKAAGQDGQGSKAEPVSAEELERRKVQELEVRQRALRRGGWNEL